MLNFPHIKPYIVKIGPLQVRWYGLMYLAGFAASYYLVKKQIIRKKLNITGEDLESLYFYIVLGLILGARLGYVVFYNLPYYLSNPLDIFAVWHGGMSFHGGLIGVIAAGIIFSARKGIRLLQIGDLVTATAPIGLMCGRIGNFINGELYGRVTSVPWAMVFPGGGNVPRHPSQLYEAFFEGPVLFVILWFMKDRVRHDGMVVGLFLVFYGIIRFIIEFFREPDAQLGLIIGPFSMGQLLSTAMIIGGGAFMVIIKRRSPANN
ncbi:prolipoprotein diacylglyceryl transferase [bacterium BMS3Abin07]|nr:prolipoprotein diacylglyceryl transferase [bacterium BMS3Abin07]GBE31946.1 prolipoprotein diacylglyceryl transferase [bacterium BMS3Bbin05]HDL19711.1 prolipoprotein diacylglyceryl transferase [Nitrospirota bacterium]HDZ87914.1 prolipoprotein diacylglyceryl transferase [Nitrospirota bacterium]